MGRFDDLFETGKYADLFEVAVPSSTEATGTAPTPPRTPEPPITPPKAPFATIGPIPTPQKPATGTFIQAPPAPEPEIDRTPRERAIQRAIG